MDLRQRLLANAWLQLLLVAVICVLANTWSARTFTRVDLTEDRIYSLDMTTRSLMYRLEKPLIAKVYFTRGLQAPYNNIERNVVDKLEDLRAYSHGLMDIQVTDPTGDKERMEEAERFGITPIQYRYRSANSSELRRVFMGVAFVYGERQEVLPAITQTQTLEYDLARTVKALVSDEERKTIGYTVGNGEPDLGTQGGPVTTLRSGLAEQYNLERVTLGGTDPIPEDVDALFVVGPQKTLSERARYQLDQFLMRGGAIAVFLSNTKPDLRTLRPRFIYHGLEPLLAHYGVTVNRDSVIDRTQNWQLSMPVRRGNSIVSTAINHPIVPVATDLNADSLVVRDLDSMKFPFVSSLTLADPLPPDVEATVLAQSSAASGRVQGIVTLAPDAYRMVLPGEETGQWPLLVSLSGTWKSYYADRDIPKVPGAAAEVGSAADDPAGKLRESAPTRIVVSGSADFIANNVDFVLNLADWLVQDESLIAIRSKQVQLAPLDPIDDDKARLIKLTNLSLGPVLLLLVGLVRWASRRSTTGYRDPVKVTDEGSNGGEA